jgi:hypothetical protein
MEQLEGTESCTSWSEGVVICYIFHGKSTCNNAWTQQCGSAAIYEIKLCVQQCPMSKIVGMIVVKRGLYLQCAWVQDAGVDRQAYRSLYKIVSPCIQRTARKCIRVRSIAPRAKMSTRIVTKWKVVMPIVRAFVQHASDVTTLRVVFQN